MQKEAGSAILVKRWCGQIHHRLLIAYLVNLLQQLRNLQWHIMWQLLRECAHFSRMYFYLSILPLINVPDSHMFLSSHWFLKHNWKQTHVADKVWLNFPSLQRRETQYVKTQVISTIMHSTYRFEENNIIPKTYRYWITWSHLPYEFYSCISAKLRFKSRFLLVFVCVK